MKNEDKILNEEQVSTDRVIQVAQIVDDSERKFKNPQTGRVYSVDGIAPTIDTCQGGGREPKIIVFYEKKSNK